MNPAFATAGWARRILALFVDWIASTLVVVLFVGWSAYADQGGPEQFYVLIVFVLETALFSALAGGSFGKIATRLRTVRVSGDPRPINLVGALARQILVAVVVPPLIFKPDGRGLHDLAVGSATVTLETWRQLAGTSQASRSRS
ncbi:RDD family protein [Nocardioides sp. Kera G14]|uniref:RDD family protein n=1 Tax=Nocardioides sp. Kera G14 TaxID=2884264 RepID=UPI001D122AD8|nr:RDD family protein [Nocardioides sp. Kera G14]UDY25049.1 RDD family protein [Nocardioides sp. Kera G14]